MKHFILLTVFTLIFIGKVSSQFLEIGNKWIFEYREYSGYDIYSENIDSIEILSDTIINGINYYKLKASEECPCGNFTTTEFLRENDNKIYRLSNNLIEEDLMIDFNSQATYNMTYQASWFSNEIQTQVINDTIAYETLPLGDKIELMHQRIINNSSYDDDTTFKLSNKIGYVTYGLLFPDIGSGLCDNLQRIKFRCYISENDTIKISEFDCYESSMISSSTSVVNQQINLFPNPTHDILNINENFEVIKIVNNSGKECEFISKNGSVDISMLANGIYYLTLKGDNEIGNYITKVIKI